ncbi:MAG: acyl-CoA dehydrogenase [Pseudonocardiaceae bacterium]
MTGTAESRTADQRAADLERLLGDPYDPTNPFGFAAALDRDERRQPSTLVDQALSEWGFSAEFVPTALGGRLSDVDAMVRALRPVFRRDAALGLGQGVVSLMAAAPVWLAGTAAQRSHVAAPLLAGQKLAVGFHELAHGNDFLHNECRAHRTAEGLRLTGAKELINNADRAAAIVLLARTGDGGHGGAHSLLLIDPAVLPPDRFQILPRFRTAGVRACVISGWRFTDCPLPADALLGPVGSGPDTSLRAFQLTRVALPGMALGLLEAALHTVLCFMRDRRLYGSRVADLPHPRTVLAGATTDLLIADSLVTTVARALHLLPDQCSAYAAAVKYLVPRLITEGLAELASVLGARSYLRSGPHAIVGKHLRDAPVVSLGHAGESVCLLSILPQLPRLARRAWPRSDAPPPTLFNLDVPVPELALDRLTLTNGKRDALFSVLDTLLDGALVGHVARDEPAGQAVSEIRAWSTRLRAACGSLPAPELGSHACPATLAMAERYAIALAASSVLGLAPRQPPAGWLPAALVRIADLLARRRRLLPAEVAEPVFAAVTHRLESGLSFGLRPEPLPWTRPGAK